MRIWNRDKARLEAELENTQHDLQSVRQELRTVRNEAVEWSRGWEALHEMLDGRKTAAGVHVDEMSAMQVSAVYASVRLVAGAIGSLPLQLFRRTDDGREPWRATPLYRLLHDEPNPMLSAVVYWETVVSHILLAGNHYSLIGRTGGGQPQSLTPLQPHRVDPQKRDGRLIYMVLLDSGEWAAFDQDDVVHVPGVGWDGRRGMSVIRHAGRPSIGTALATDEYSGRFFSNDATPRGYIRFPEGKKLTAEQANLMRDYWYKRQQGLDNSHLPAFIPDGGEFREITMSAEDSQLIETRRFQVTDIARIFGVPPHMIGETTQSTSFGAGIEQQSIGFVMYTLRPHLRRIEQEINRKLVRRPDAFAEFNVSGLLRGDIKGRNEAYQIALGGNQQPGYMSVNEVRKLENLPPVDGGDDVYRPATGERTNASETA